VAALEAIRRHEGWQGSGPDARVGAYLACAHHPREALEPRLVLVAEAEGELVGYIAGHLTRRFGCDGELQWLAVAPDRRGGGVADALFARLAEWFAAQGVRRVCVDVVPENARARAFYRRHGARELRPSWMVWEDVGAVGTPSTDG
jgi:GNAT superfamily N-acetyltransferase